MTSLPTPPSHARIAAAWIASGTSPEPLNSPAGLVSQVLLGLRLSSPRPVHAGIPNGARLRTLQLNGLIPSSSVAERLANLGLAYAHHHAPTAAR